MHRTLDRRPRWTDRTLRTLFLASCGVYIGCDGLISDESAGSIDLVPFRPTSAKGADPTAHLPRISMRDVDAQVLTVDIVNIIAQRIPASADAPRVLRQLWILVT